MLPPVEFDARFLEEAVWAAIRGHPSAGDFHRERESLYEEADAERRDHAAARLHARWFRDLGLDAPIRQAIEEQREALGSIRVLLVRPAVREQDQDAELFVAQSGDRTVVLRLRPDLLRDRVTALLLLRRELTHVADMLDPAFAYEPRLPRYPGGPAHDRLLQDRYRILWDCSVDGRLVHRGLVPAEARARRLEEFRQAFGGARAGTDDRFEKIFDGSRPRHPDLVALAVDPGADPGVDRGAAATPQRCPLCGFPTMDFSRDSRDLPEAVVSTIRSGFPSWEPDEGLCAQCADLYRDRGTSAEAASHLPRVPPENPAASRGGDCRHVVSSMTPPGFNRRY